MLPKNYSENMYLELLLSVKITHTPNEAISIGDR